MRWWPWARRAQPVVVPPRATATVQPPTAVLPPPKAGGVRLVMGDGTAVDLPADTAQARAFGAVAEALVQGLPAPSSRSSAGDSRR
jgi:hypothetical protein